MEVGSGTDLTSMNNNRNHLTYGWVIRATETQILEINRFLEENNVHVIWQQRSLGRLYLREESY